MERGKVKEAVRVRETMGEIARERERGEKVKRGPS